ncbi:hypothetical protein jhhlp_001662 [Lomentospora prolificans]|uniref:Ketoreductase domain-containing protein n=1 Tax=Lomentospora prolificans TaxID=41688 RepID=A0A2N3NJ27_9PEZI|nr:hypothetical protein jhhlp_001662 [Lomentospora prolificans]
MTLLKEQKPKGMPPRMIDHFTGVVHHDTYPEIDPVTKSDCTGKAVLITGASKGIGYHIAIGYGKAGASQIALAARSSAAATATAVRDAAKAAGRAEPTIITLEMDVCDKASIRSAAKKVEEEWGRLDILINNAGYMAEFASLLDTDEEEYMRVWDVNYWGVFRTTKAFLPLMLKGGDKTVVNLSSVAAHFAGVGGGAYHISKFALARFTEFVQDEYASQGVLAFSIHPCGTPTHLSARLPERFRFRLGDKPELAAHSIPFLTISILALAERTAQLFLDGLGGYLIYSGGSGALTASRFTKPEAEVFADIALSMGVPVDKIIMEPLSTNMGENVRFTKAPLEQRGFLFQELYILVQKPYMERWTYATFWKQWPEPQPDFSVTSPQYSFEEYPNAENPRDLVIHIMVGDLLRIRAYPELDFHLSKRSRKKCGRQARS